MDLTPEVVRVLNHEAEMIRLCAVRLTDPGQAKALNRVIEELHLTLSRGGKIVLTGLGKSGKIAQKISATLSSTGSSSFFLHPTEAFHGDLGMLGPQDIIWAMSHAGNTEEIIRLLPVFRNRGLKIIGMGGNEGSRLAKESDLWIDSSISAEACPLNLTPTASTTLALALGDAISVALMKVRSFTAADFATNHPGGTLGRRLNLKVADLMHRDDELPIEGPDATMRDVVVTSSKKRFGTVLIVENQRLLGIITDGDIRRALQKSDQFFQYRAREIMTSNPMSVTPEALAVTALEMMENGPRKVTVLPVVDTDGKCRGIVHIHDLVSRL